MNWRKETTLRNMKISDIAVEKLIPYANNPRDNDKAVDAVAESIKEFGFKNPIIIDKDYVIVAGHTRLKAALKLGLKVVPCIIADDLTEEQVNAFRLADNKTAELSDWNEEELLEELKKIESINMELFSFNLEDLEKELTGEAQDDDFNEDEELPETPTSQKGDIYLLGKHRVMCGDSTKKEDVDILCDGRLANMIFTDPPYNVNYEGTAGTIQNDNMEDESFFNFLVSAFNNLYDHIKLGGSIYVCHADTEGLNFRNAFKQAGFKLAECLVWVKNALVLGRQDYHWRHEPILYGWKEGAAHYFVDDRTQDTVWEYNKPKNNDLHPTMKPLELVGKAISNSSRMNQTVLDLFGGSGSTLIASEQLQRESLLMEIDEKYVDVIVRRYIKFKGTHEGCFLLRGGERIPLTIETTPDLLKNIEGI